VTGTTEALPTGSIKELRIPFRGSIGLGAASLASLGVLSHAALHNDVLAAAAIALAVGLIAAAAFTPSPFVRLWPPLVPLLIALTASAEVAVAANRPAPELQSSAWFILWLAVIGLLTATAIRGRFRGAVVRLVRFHRMELAQVGVLLAFALLLRAFDPARFPAPVQTDEADYAISALGAVLTTLTATAVVLPLATWWIGHPTEFKGRLNEVGITSRPGESPSWLETQRDAGRSYPDIFATQSIDSIRAVFGGPEATQFLASDRGMFDLVATALIVLGAIVARLRIRDPAYFLPLASVALGIIFGGILVIPAASSARLIAVIPGACALAAIGARYLIDAVPRPTRFATVPAICALAAMPGLLHYTTHQGAYQRWQGADPLPGFANVVALSHAGDTIVWVTPPGDPPPFPPKLNLLLRETGVVMLTKDDTILQKRPPLTETPLTRRVVLLIPPGGSASEYCAVARLLEPSVELGPALPVDAYQAAQQDCIRTTDVAQ
jgi:hypothetical protein